MRVRRRICCAIGFGLYAQGAGSHVSILFDVGENESNPRPRVQQIGEENLFTMRVPKELRFGEMRNLRWSIDIVVVLVDASRWVEAEPHISFIDGADTSWPITNGCLFCVVKHVMIIRSFRKVGGVELNECDKTAGWGNGR